MKNQMISNTLEEIQPFVVDALRSTFPGMDLDTQNKDLREPRDYIILLNGMGPEATRKMLLQDEIVLSNPAERLIVVWEIRMWSHMSYTICLSLTLKF